MKWLIAVAAAAMALLLSTDVRAASPNIRNLARHGRARPGARPTPVTRTPGGVVGRGSPGGFPGGRGGGGFGGVPAGGGGGGGGGGGCST